MEKHLAEVARRATEVFGVHLRGTGTFRPVSPVVFVTLVEGISQCEQLAGLVRRGPLAIELEFPYHPHVTVAHHLDDAALDRAFEELAGFDCTFDGDGVPPLCPRRRGGLAAGPVVRAAARAGGDLTPWPR